MYNLKPHTFVSSTYSKTLPSVCQYFVGREKEIEELMAEVNFESRNSTSRIINVIGLAGIGKSQLVLKVGHEMMKQFGVRVDYVDLADFSGENLPTFLAQKLSKITDIKVTFDRVLNQLCDNDLNRPKLLIFDNCDNLMPMQNENLKRAIQQIVKKSSNVKVLMTSREEAFQIEYYSLYIVHELSNEAQHCHS